MALILVPTPLADGLPLEPVAQKRMEAGLAAEPPALICVEEPKVARRRWLAWGLPRAAVDGFRVLNEHSTPKDVQALVADLRAGRDVFLMSDGGLPAFCDPGRDLVEACHRAGVPVRSTPFPHSVSLAVALSGFDASRFTFRGFPPREDGARQGFLAECLRMRETVVIMDTPYRLGRLVEEVSRAAAAGAPQREGCLVMDLGTDQETAMRAPLKDLAQRLGEAGKREFVLVLGPSP